MKGFLLPHLTIMPALLDWLHSHGTLIHLVFNSMTNGTFIVSLRWTMDRSVRRCRSSALLSNPNMFLTLASLLLMLPGSLIAKEDPSLSPTPPPTSGGSLGFVHGFIASLSMIIVSEIGDKTFFIAAIMSMKHSRLTVFFGAISALALMTILSVFFGWIATVIPRAYTYYISTALFAIFGLKMLRDGYLMSPNEAQEEFEEVQSDLRKREEEFEKEVLSSEIELGLSAKKQAGASVWLVVSRIILQAFTLTFLAEWGDRSQLATIVLAAREDVYGVTLGGILGHSLCTGIAVIGGRFIAQKISVRTVTMIGGVVFLIFAFSALVISPEWDT